MKQTPGKTILWQLKLRPFLIACLFFVACSCENSEIDPPPADEPQDTTTITTTEYSIHGWVQKGPFINGTAITISELKPDLRQTGINYSAEILDNKGSFELNGIHFSSSYVELKASGFYFNEISNEISSAPLTLFAISDIKDKSTLNVNVLSYLEKGRIQYLVSAGEDFSKAKIQAQKEVLEIFHMDSPMVNASEQLDISAGGDENAMLLAASLILQGYLSVPEMAELLANINTDIREDGVLNSETLGSQLINTAKKLDLIQLRENIELRYETMGQQIEVAPFEKYILNFIDSSGYVTTDKIEYPLTGSNGPNILNDENLFFPEGDYSMTAILPDGFSLKVEIIGESFGSYYSQDNPGWNRSNYDMETNTTTYSSNRTGTIDFKMVSMLNEANLPSTVKIFENGAQEPTRTRVLAYDNSTGFTIPETGLYGQNLFALTDSSTVDTSLTYSLAIQVPNDKPYDIEIIMSFSQENSYAIDSLIEGNWIVNKSPLELRLTLNGQNIAADLPITFLNNGDLTISGGVKIWGIHW